MIQERRLRLCLLPFKDIVMPKTHFGLIVKFLVSLKTESSAKSACDAAYDEILKYYYQGVEIKEYAKISS